jgi:uncharacterized damage-inducible protein DinB
MTTPLKNIYTELALYNQWQNQGLYRICNDLGEAAREMKRPALFFGSLRETLDHVAHVDSVLLQFILSGEPAEDFRPGELQYPNFDELAARRVVLDAEILGLITGSAEPWIQSHIEFFSPRLGRRRSFPRTFLLTQMFNHQTHHRAQATAALHELGIDYGPTDLPMNPLSQF